MFRKHRSLSDRAAGVKNKSKCSLDKVALNRLQEELVAAVGARLRSAQQNEFVSASVDFAARLRALYFPFHYRQTVGRPTLAFPVLHIELGACRGAIDGNVA